MIITYSVTVFLTQLIFIGSRTWNVKAIAKNNLLHALLSGTVVHLSWFVSITIGAKSGYELINQSWEYWPVVVCSLIGGLIGTWIGMLEKKKI